MYILINGDFHLSEENVFGYTFPDHYLFGEKIRAIRNEMPFFYDHLDLILLKFKILNEFTPPFVKNKGRELKRQIERVLVKNKLYRSTIVHIHFFQEKGQISYLIVPEPLDTFEYEFNQKGVLTDLFDKVPKALTNLSNLSLGSDLYWKIARQHLDVFSADDYVLINTDGYVLECPEKNIYLLIGNTIHTPSVESGIYVDVARQTVLNIIAQLGFQLEERPDITIDDLYEADEAFVANSLLGIQWLLGFREKRYYNTQCRRLADELNSWAINQRY